MTKNLNMSINVHKLVHNFDVKEVINSFHDRKGRENCSMCLYLANMESKPLTPPDVPFTVCHMQTLLRSLDLIEMSALASMQNVRVEHTT